MSLEPQSGQMPGFGSRVPGLPDIPIARPPQVVLDEPELRLRPTPKPVPVARPAPPKPQLQDAPGEGEEELLPPSALKGWATSITLHAILLLLPAFWFFSPSLNPPKIIDTRLAGSEFGDESGTSLTGGLGMDTPLAMPEIANAPRLEEVAPTLTSPALSDVNVELSNRATPPEGAANGGGQNLTNPGQGGSGDGFGVARFGHGGERINGVDVKVGDPQFTLIWDTRADLDLHVLEPGGSHIYWEERNGKQGAELDVDDVDGFGPENVYWGGEMGKGNGPPGEYKWYVHYYGGLGGNPVPTRWKMRLKHDGKVTVFEGKLRSINERSRVYSFVVGADGTAAADRPASKGRMKSEDK